MYIKEFMCKTESFRTGKEHCIIQTELHAVMLSSKTAVLVCAFRFSCPRLPPSHFEGVHVPPVPMVAPPMENVYTVVQETSWQSYSAKWHAEREKAEAAKDWTVLWSESMTGS